MPKPRIMALTPELVQLCCRDEPDLGPDPGLHLLDDSDFRHLAETLDAQSADGPLWVFAYGSLIWKPEFDATETLRATTFGWHRSFCLKMDRWRASPQQPGLMMALERGGQCDGVVYRLPEGDRVAQIERLLRREIVAHETVSSVRWLRVRTAAGDFPALGFWVGMTGESMSLRQPLAAVAGILARACGHVGSCAEYLHNTVVHLEPSASATAISGGCRRWWPRKSGRSIVSRRAGDKAPAGPLPAVAAGCVPRPAGAWPRVARRKEARCPCTSGHSFLYPPEFLPFPVLPGYGSSSSGAAIVPPFPGAARQGRAPATGCAARKQIGGWAREHA